MNKAEMMLLLAGVSPERITELRDERAIFVREQMFRQGQSRE